ncbi:hypothetical protein R6Q59_030398 [Mikania micrantha]
MSSIEAVKHLQIPLRELSDASNEFSDQNIIAKGGFGNVYKGESVKHGKIAIKMLDPERGQGDHEFKTEIALLSLYKHENIVSLIGFCHEDGKKILIYRYESNGSLDNHLSNTDRTWIQRLQICLDAARGLQYLHVDVGAEHRIIHRDVKSANILLDENWKAKISDFGLCRVGTANTQTTFFISNACGTIGYIDPDFLNTGYLTQKSDVYSFGVVLFELLCGRPTIVRKYKDNRVFLTNLIKTHWRRETLDEIIYSDLQNQIKTASLLTFTTIAYQCLMSGNERPTMKKVVEQLQKALYNQLFMSSTESVNHLQILLQELSDTSNGFSDQNLIAKGGFGNVYKGESVKHGKIAIKMLDPGQGQGDHEFRTEISLLSLYKHDNIVSLIGFCDEEGQKILVYKYEGNGSLDKHLSNKYLTWIQRLQICLDAASGLQYLHDDVGADHRILHRDVKSANILLDENWKAKISDFGLCRGGPANKQTTFLISNACGTFGYIDPDFLNTGYLTQRSDVYSFGVVLFEVLCGRPTIVSKHKDNRDFLTNLIKTHWRKKTLDDIIYSDLQNQIKRASMLTFTKIAYQCLMSGNERPTMKKVVEQLQKAFNYQLTPSVSDDSGFATHLQGQSGLSASSPESTHVSSSQSWEYDVFVSFRGEDTRKNFTDYLYSALMCRQINTYKDNLTLPSGESMIPSLIMSIQKSRIAIILFSKNYAASSWCLDELAFIMKNRDEQGQIVIPFYYDVDPSEVREQRGLYGAALDRHELKYDNNKVQSWREALTSAGGLAGWECNKG